MLALTASNIRECGRSFIVAVQLNVVRQIRQFGVDHRGKGSQMFLG